MRYSNCLWPPAFRPLHIVDRAPADYLHLRDWIDGGPWPLDLFSGAGAAIRHARQLASGGDGGEVWLVNSQLPEMSGADLIRMLREIRGPAVLAIVADQYDGGEEIAAYQAGAANYMCKPVSCRLLTEVCAPRPVAFEHFAAAVHARPP